MGPIRTMWSRSVAQSVHRLQHVVGDGRHESLSVDVPQPSQPGPVLPQPVQGGKRSFGDGPAAAHLAPVVWTEVDPTSWTGLRVSQARVRVLPGNDTSTRSGEFPRSFDSSPGAFMVSWNTSARVRGSTGPLETNLPADSGMAKPRSFKLGDRWFACYLGDQPFYRSSP